MKKLLSPADVNSVDASDIDMSCIHDLLKNAKAHSVTMSELVTIVTATENEILKDNFIAMIERIAVLERAVKTAETRSKNFRRGVID